MKNVEELKSVFSAIFNQIGGNRLVAMTGARNFCMESEQEGGLSFRLPRFPGVKINYVKIILSSSDLYEICL